MVDGHEDDRADQRHDEAAGGHFPRVEAKDPAEKPAEKCARDADHQRSQPTPGLTTGDDQPSKGPDDEPENREIGSRSCSPPDPLLCGREGAWRPCHQRPISRTTRAWGRRRHGRRDRSCRRTDRCPLPSDLQDLFLHLGRRQADDAEVDCVAQRVLAVRRDAMALFTEHLVELGAAIARNELETSARIANGDLSQELEQARIQRQSRSGGAIGRVSRKSDRCVGSVDRQRHGLAGVHVEQRCPGRRRPASRLRGPAAFASDRPPRSLRVAWPEACWVGRSASVGRETGSVASKLAKAGKV